MPKYMWMGNFTPQGGKGVLAEGGSSRVRAVAATMESLGGKLEAYYFAFGADDYVIIADLPDNQAAAAGALAVNSSGAVNNRTIVLLTGEEVDAAARRSPTYRAPGG
ncbi:MAG TPA: GYD domain-containing protein [Candidatus Dormibacteraeota bacterium]|nr:GYD domain-containing protein [Candidatus Dormibacteraeota bacterium]